MPLALRKILRYFSAVCLNAPKKRLDPTKRAVALRLYHERNHTVEEICRMMGVGRSTLYNYLTEAERDALQSS